MTIQNGRSVLCLTLQTATTPAEEGALAAGARFAAGYPITPSTEVVERFAARVPTVGGTFIQMEDELAASIALQGGVWGERRRSR